MSAVFEIEHRLRPMAEADLPRIHRIELASYEYPWSQGNFADSLQAGYSMWVREAGGEIIGYYVMMAAAGEAHLLNLTIAPSWRRHGLGRDLLEHCLARACDHKASSMFLEVRISNDAAIGLYHGSGFVDLAVRRGYYPARGGREDALIMKKELAC
ncbi:ribosomal protein S18-alanine N-acetyltransferase [Thiobacillus sedimenti]|uniref:[Ribosomal protein bS18]-alanine N-acetyltransferase n=1 Tax=Thiobacillus sedimenti TaxID=3110231 RepID=A0ABZ1CJI5_9PROT|nr:ribosomal protein S18-alanine N-acetyltransferase [Thiobacillus sp. SCUT-2]WRS38103.1 ribosomal protein S18-alanine N-acetyltransferase [Thiobacillus sp. SCUT-2]